MLVKYLSACLPHGRGTVRRMLGAGALLCVLGTVSARADERVDHYRGEPSATPEEALANLVEYNRRLQATLDGAMTDRDLATVHELTYTLENALQRLSDEIGTAATILEKVHQASETADRQTVESRGRAYLDAVETITTWSGDAGPND